MRPASWSGERLAAGGPWTDLATVAANVTTYTDATVSPGQTYFYQVIAINRVGYPGPAAQPGAYSTLPVSSASNIASDYRFGSGHSRRQLRLT